MQILLIEDDAMLGQALVSALAQLPDAVVTWQRDAFSAKLALLDQAYNVVLLDLGLPDQSGLSVLSALRARHDTTPVMIITAQARLSDRIRGLDAGADDYIIKPFELDELLARMRALIRRSTQAVSAVMRRFDVEVNPGQRAVSKAGVPVALSAHEYRTLTALMQSQGKPLSRDYLESMIYGERSSVESNTVAVYIHQLRRKLGEELIETVHGVGYRIGEPGA
jgi:two-component system OmpR family response regulator